MPLYLKETKKNPKTNKYEKTGKLEQVGNVSRGSAGGYTKGVITGLQQTNQQSLSGPVYSPPGSNQPPNIVPNIPPTAPVLPNSPFINGYNPNLPPTLLQPVNNQPPQQPQQGAVSPPAGSVSAPLPSPSPQEALPLTGLTDVSGNRPGFDQFGNEIGQAAPITPADVMVLQGFAGLAKSVATTMASFARDAALASTVGGAEVLAVQAVPRAASGVVKAGASSAGKAAVNTATTKGLVDLATETAAGKLVSLGLILTTLKSSLSTSKEYKKESTAKIIEVTDVLNKLQRSGDPGLMQQGQILRDQLGEAVNDVNRYRSYAPFGVLSGEVDKDFDELEILLKEATLKYDNNVQDDAGKAVIEQLGNSPSQEDVDAAKVFLNSLPTGQTKTDLQKAINEAQSQADARSALEAQNAERQRQEFQQQQTLQQQEFQRTEREARQAYEQSVRDAAAAQKQFEEDTQTTTSEGGTLTFGLLGGGGATEFVSADRASQAYFGKNYAELTPAQKQLLNLLKGGN